MIAFAKQRVVGWSLFLILSAVVVWLHFKFASDIPQFAFLSGWALFAIILALTLYNARKKLPFLPLLSSETWLQFHIYAGLFTGVLFAIHVSYRIPTGW